MRHRVNAIFALQTPHGLAYGCTREMEADRMTFQVAGVLAIGEVVEWRMQLVGRGEAVTGSLRVEGRLPAPPGETPIYEGRILSLSPEQRARLDAWLAERSGSASREPRRPVPIAAKAPSPPAPAARTPPAEAPRPAAAAPPRAAGDAPVAADGRPQERRPAGGRDAISKALKVTIERVKRVPTPAQRPLAGAVELPDDDWTDAPRSVRAIAPTPSDEARAPASREPARPLVTPPREEARAAPPRTGAEPTAPRIGAGPPLTAPAVVPAPTAPPRPPPADVEGRDGLGTQGGQRKPPVPRSAAQAPHRSIADEPLPASVDPAGHRSSMILSAPPSVETSPTAQDPTVAIRPGTDPLQVRVVWSSAAAYVRDHRRYLKGDGVFLPIVDPPSLRARGCRLYVRLVLPSGGQVVCGGEVVAPMSQGVGVALQLTPDQRATLASELDRG